MSLRLLLALAAIGWAVPVVAQVCPPGVPERLCQDELDLQARANVVQGSGARAFGMGGAFLARADDATAASWNPAGLSYLRRPELSFVWTPKNALDSVERSAPGATVERDQRHGTAPDFFALTYPFEGEAISGAAQLSFQRVIPFGGTRTIMREGKRLDVDSGGGFDVLALGSGIQLSRTLRVGVTFNHWMNGYSQSLDKEVELFRRNPKEGEEPAFIRFIRRTHQDTDTRLSGSNLHVGVIWSPWESLNLGAVGKTDFIGDMTLGRFRKDIDDDVIVTFNSRQQTNLKLAFPGSIGVGASWRPRSTLTLSMDFTRTYWSAAKIFNFFTLPRRVPNTTEPPPLVQGADMFFANPYPSLTNQQEDGEQVRIGAEHVLILGRIKLPLRAGYFDDRQYFRAGDGSIPHLRGITAGAGLIMGPMLFDVAYVHERGGYQVLAAVPEAGQPVQFDRVSVKSDRIYVSLIYRKR